MCANRLLDARFDHGGNFCCLETCEFFVRNQRQIVHLNGHVIGTLLIENLKTVDQCHRQDGAFCLQGAAEAAAVELAHGLYSVSRGWTWAQLIDDGKALLAIDAEDDTRIISTDKKAEKAGGLYLALAGVLVKPTDDIDTEKEYQLIALPE